MPVVSSTNLHYRSAQPTPNVQACRIQLSMASAYCSRGSGNVDLLQQKSIFPLNNHSQPIIFDKQGEWLFWVFACLMSVVGQTCFLSMFQLSTIGRCEYDKTCSLLVQLFDESAQRYQELVNSRTQGAELSVQEGMWLLWCLHTNHVNKFSKQPNRCPISLYLMYLVYQV